MYACSLLQYIMQQLPIGLNPLNGTGLCQRMCETAKIGKSVTTLEKVKGSVSKSWTTALLKTPFSEIKSTKVCLRLCMLSTCFLVSESKLIESWPTADDKSLSAHQFWHRAAKNIQKQSFRHIPPGKTFVHHHNS